MRLRVFTAATMPQALALARTALGEDAFILSNRRTRDGFEVTAAREDAPAPVAPPPPMPFAAHGIPSGIAGLLDGAPDHLERKLAATLGFAALALAGRSPPLMVVGPPGAGKTLTVARLATRLTLAGSRPMVVTTDGNRPCAAEQLAAYTRLLGIELVAVGPAGLPRALTRREPGAPVLIDSAGCDAFAAGDRARLAETAAAAQATLIAVLPAGLDAAESAEAAAALAEAGAAALVATRLDLARRLGGVVAAATHARNGGGGLPLAEAGIGPGAADGLVPMTPALLAQRLLTAQGGGP